MALEAAPVTDSKEETLNKMDVEGTAQSPTHESTEQGKSNKGSNHERYLVLVEFVYRHLNFQMAELESILETHGISLGSDDCRISPLPTPESSSVPEKNRAFTILSFPLDQASKWSGLLQTPEEQNKWFFTFLKPQGSLNQEAHL